MLIEVAGYTKRFVGTRKDSGAPYDFFKVYLAVPVRDGVGMYAVEKYVDGKLYDKMRDVGIYAVTYDHRGRIVDLEISL